MAAAVRRLDRVRSADHTRHAETPWLTGNHTIFGEIVEGYDVVEKIVNVPRNRQDKPNEDVVLEKVTIERS